MNFNSLKKNKKQPTKQEKSRGRSMVEMLGVLAIIGILSIGGIQGYTLAMRRYRANEIVEVMMKYVTIAYTGFQNYAQNNEVRSYTRYSDNPPVYETKIEVHGEQHWTMCMANSPTSCGIPGFESAGLGPLPKGVSGMHQSFINAATDQNGSTEYYDNKGMPASDYVALLIRFDNEELCKTAYSILSAYSNVAGSDEADTLKGCSQREHWLVRSIPVN